MSKTRVSFFSFLLCALTACQNETGSQAHSNTQLADTSLTDIGIVDASCFDSVPGSAPKQLSPLPDFFAASIGKYPREVQFFDRPDIRARLLTLMGSEMYNVMKLNFFPQKRIQKVGKVIKVTAGKNEATQTAIFEISYHTENDRFTVQYRFDDMARDYKETKKAVAQH